MKKGGKEEIFTVPGGKNVIFEKKGRGKNINNFDNIHPCELIVVFLNFS